MTAPTETACATCAFADTHGWWGPGHAGTHCRRCHLSWASTAQAHCVVCCAHFTTAAVADRHWCDGHGPGERQHSASCDGQHGRPWAPRHLDPGAAGLHLGPDGMWSTSAARDPTAVAERFRAVRQNGRQGSRGLKQSRSTAGDGGKCHPGAQAPETALR